MKIKELYEKFSGFIKFGIVGAINTLISLVIYMILLKFDVQYLVASTIGYLAGIFNGYICSSKFVFKKQKSMETGVKFILVYISSLAINLCLVYLLVEMLGMDKLIAQLIATGCNLIYNYLLNKVWTFREHKSKMKI
ncbi:MAG TPA: GtrA family protein [Epulopiscium sp.]|nr:GtrA family protein [Candidatus Epulonipiscium sp.]